MDWLLIENCVSLKVAARDDVMKSTEKSSDGNNTGLKTPSSTKMRTSLLQDNSPNHLTCLILTLQSCVFSLAHYLTANDEPESTDELQHFNA